MFDEIHLIREWIGAVPMDAPLYPLWGCLVRALSWVSGDILRAVSMTSAFFFGLNAVLIFYAVRGIFSVPVRIAERLAVFEEMKYTGLELFAATTVTIVYLATPGFFAAAYQPSPLMFAQFFPAFMFFAVARLVRAVHLQTFVSWTLLLGMAAACSFLNGAIGWLPLPLVLVALFLPVVRKGLLVVPALGIYLLGFTLTLTLLVFFCFASPLTDLIRVVGLTVQSLPEGFFYPGAVVFFVIGILPLIVGWALVSTGRIRPKVLRLTYFWGWLGLAGGVALVTVIVSILGAKRPNVQFVDGILETLSGRDVIISDGTFDDLLSFRLPKGVTLLTLGADKVVPPELLETVTDEEARFAADLGTAAFAEDWLKHDLSAFRRVVVISSKPFETVAGGTLVPEGWCWRSELETNRPSGEALRDRWMARWDSVSAQLKDRSLPTWQMRRLFAVQGLQIAEILKAEGNDKSAENLTAFVVGHIDASFSREVERRWTIDRNRVFACVRKLGELDSLSAYARSARLVELEDHLLPELEQSIGSEASWLVHVYRGEIALKKGVEFRTVARDEYRAATHDERSDLKATAGKLLLLDAALRDDPGTRADALAILRRDRNNRMALAIRGNALASDGDNAKAEACLRRATAPGAPVMVEPLNDLAEVLSRQGRLAEALEISDRVLSLVSVPNWTFLETRAALLMRLGRLEEATTYLRRAVEQAEEQKQEDVARNILDIDRARLMKLQGVNNSEYRNFVRNIKARNLTPAHRNLADEL